MTGNPQDDRSRGLNPVDGPMAEVPERYLARGGEPVTAPAGAAISGSSADMAARALPGWTLCISTLNRRAVLKKCLEHAYGQTRPPDEVVIVDASDEFEEARAEIEALSRHVPLTYIRAEKRSLPAQRNQGIAASTKDILFLIDDDSFMHPDGAERILELYAADHEEHIAAIAFRNVPFAGPDGGQQVERKKRGLTGAASFQRIAKSSRVARWFKREVLMMSMERAFIGYDLPEERARTWSLNDELANEVIPVSFIAGYALTARRKVAVHEPFDGNLLAYSPAEDLDATYRYARHGLLVKSKAAKVHHVEAAAARLKRMQVTTLTLANIAYFVRAKSAARWKHTRRFHLMVVRRLLAWFLKDLLTLRLTFPNVRGVWRGIRHARGILDYEGPDLPAFFTGVQKEILAMR
ncbi:glycosyltransferase [Roseibacterium sp. SDUM158017]|uniref:glycosyltransferase family 2 protein n=1 Tax=Roseicyclus salinarum TaxID=3036773 RepID=UPI0024152F50|nr:glycosyltransferase [Roseibacterium sp. SDUM158017]MDG4649647.1 glycosyltransferase [Roseibacterium sp. SDUM158017]